MNAEPVRRTSPRQLLAVFAVFLSIFVGYCCIAPSDREALAREVGLVARDVEFGATVVDDPELAEDLDDLSVILTDISKALQAGDSSGVSSAIVFVEEIAQRDDLDDDVKVALLLVLSTLRRIEQ